MTKKATVQTWIGLLVLIVVAGTAFYLIRQYAPKADEYVDPGSGGDEVTCAAPEGEEPLTSLLIPSVQAAAQDSQTGRICVTVNLTSRPGIRNSNVNDINADEPTKIDISSSGPHGRGEPCKNDLLTASIPADAVFNGGFMGVADKLGFVPIGITDNPDRWTGYCFNVKPFTIVGHHDDLPDSKKSYECEPPKIMNARDEVVGDREPVGAYISPKKPANSVTIGVFCREIEVN